MPRHPPNAFDEDENTEPHLILEPSNVVTTVNSRDERVGFLGSGLPRAALATVVAVSTTAFLFWGGPLWRAAAGASHVGRIGGSYLIVVPLVLCALAIARRSSWSHLLASVAIVWSAKLVITATAYTLIAPGSATEYAPLRTWETGPATSREARAVESGPTREGTGHLSGIVLDAGTPLTEVALVVGDFDAMGYERTPKDVRFVVEGSRYAKSIYLVSPRDRLLVDNRDAILHTVRFIQEGRAIANVPFPPGFAEHPISTPAPGAYGLSCENHTSENALLVVVAHPFAALADAKGHFELRDVPAGEREISILRQGHPPVHRSIRVAKDAVLEVSIDLQ